MNNNKYIVILAVVCNVMSFITAMNQEKIVNTQEIQAQLHMAHQAVQSLESVPTATAHAWAHIHLNTCYYQLISRASRWEPAKRDGKLCWVIKPEEHPSPKDDTQLWQDLADMASKAKRHIDSLHESVIDSELREKATWVCALISKG
ncbi:MAG: hypothetical protein AB7F19_00875 [Candidatus Babeliales bacterium]